MSDTSMTTGGTAPTNLELLESGNYTRLAAECQDGSWEYFAALGIIGRSREALDGLRTYVDDVRARFYLGVALWMAGEEKLAMETLATVNSNWAVKLLKLISKSEINVLVLNMGNRREMLHGAGFLSTLRDHRRFDGCVINTEGDLPRNTAYADITDYYGRLNPPDFFICREVEWHNIPLNLQQLPCPIFGHTFDFDIHVQCCAPWLKLFDELIVSNHIEGEILKRISGGEVSTYPRCYGSADMYDFKGDTERDIDLFISGNMLHPYQPDKGRILHQLLELPESEVRIRVEPFLKIDEYRSLMERSKTVVAYVRNGGALATRALEALQMGCAVLVQDTGVLPLYLGEREGVFTYSMERGDLGDVVRRVVREWPQYKSRITDGRDAIRREFSMQRVADQYLRYLTFRAAKPRRRRTVVSTEGLIQKRIVLYLGPSMPRSVYGQIIDKGFPLWQKQLQNAPSAGPYINMARELVLAHTDTVHPEASQRFDPEALRAEIDPRLLSDAFLFYNVGRQAFPRSLVLLFNFVRVALHFGSPQEVRGALDVAESALTQAAAQWELEAEDDVFSWDFYGEMFNYRAYFDELIGVHSGGLLDKAKLINLILASMHYYLSFYHQEIMYAGRAAELDPDFAAYTYRYARLLSQGGSGDELKRAGDLLVRLVEDSILYDAAWGELERLSTQGHYEHPRLEFLRKKIEQARKRTVSLNKLHETLARPVSLKPAV